MHINRKKLAVTGILLTTLGLLTTIYLSFPNIDPTDRVDLKFPKDLKDLKKLGLLLSRYKEQHYGCVLFGVFTVYILLQSFAIPGSIFLSIISGYLFAFPIALLLVCTCSAAGAAVCYFLSYMIGRKLVIKYFPERVMQWQMQVAKHRDNLLSYVIFLRVTPFLPNWFMNIASPVIDVPLSPFFWGTFIGVAPPSFFYIQAGTTLQQMTSAEQMSILSWSTVLPLAICALLSLLPVLFKNRLKAHIE